MRTLQNRLEYAKAALANNYQDMTIRDILLEVNAWLDDHRKAANDSLHQNKPDALGNFFIIPCITFIDRTLKPSLESPLMSEVTASGDGDGGNPCKPLNPPIKSPAPRPQNSLNESQPTSEEKACKPTIKECFYLKNGKCISQEVYRKVNGMDTGMPCPFSPDALVFPTNNPNQPTCLEFTPNRKRKINTTLSWDEKYPASYEFKPSQAFHKTKPIGEK